jgi:hypothetical protein
MKYYAYPITHRLIDGPFATLLGVSPALLTHETLVPAHNEIRVPEGLGQITGVRQIRRLLQSTRLRR